MRTRQVKTVKAMVTKPPINWKYHRPQKASVSSPLLLFARALEMLLTPILDKDRTQKIIRNWIVLLTLE